MGDRRRHRLGRPGRLRVGRALREAGFDVIGLENDMRARFFGPGGLHPPGHRAAGPASSRSSARSTWTSATPTPWSACSPSTAPQIELVVHTAAQPSHDWAASDPLDRLRRQRQRHAQPARGGAPALPRRHLHLHLHQQGLRRHAEPPAAGGARDAPRAARRPPLLRRHRHHDDDRRLDALAVRRLEGRRRPDGPGVRALLRHAHRLLSRRLPDRPQPRRRASCTASCPT